MADLAGAPATNHAQEVLLALSFRYCVLDGSENVNCHACRTWLLQSVCKEDNIPWAEMLGSDFETEGTYSIRDLVRRMKSKRCLSGDFIRFFQWALSSMNPSAAAIRQRLRTNHPELPTYEAAIEASAASPLECPIFPTNINLARAHASETLRKRGATKRGKKGQKEKRCVNICSPCPY